MKNDHTDRPQLFAEEVLNGEKPLIDPMFF